jgi:hypothetical protein
LATSKALDPELQGPEPLVKPSALSFFHGEAQQRFRLINQPIFNKLRPKGGKSPDYISEQKTN